MSADIYYQPQVSAFSTTSSAAVASDLLKCDFQNAVRRNLHSWARWRTELNNNLVDAVLNGSRLADHEPIGACLDRDSPQRGHPTNNPKTLLTYSAAAHSSTPLPKDEFYKFGIPRARINPPLQSHQEQQRHLANGPEIVRRPPLTSSSAPDLIGERRRAVGYCPTPSRTVDAATLFDRRRGHSYEDDADDDDDDDNGEEELVLDYFDFKDAPPTSDNLLRRRQFHRSAATLPTVPSWSDDVIEAVASRNQISVSASAKKSMERRGQVNQSQEQNKKIQQLQHRQAGIPSQIDPFSRRRMITARRDDVLYTTRNVWQLDENI